MLSFNTANKLCIVFLALAVICVSYFRMWVELHSLHSCLKLKCIYKFTL